jgi:hypothetical protein
LIGFIVCPSEDDLELRWRNTDSVNGVKRIIGVGWKQPNFITTALRATARFEDRPLSMLFGLHYNVRNRPYW